MELLKLDKFPHNNRSFEIHTYRDKVKDRILLLAYERSEDKAIKIPDILEEVNMYGRAAEHHHEYADYLSAVANIRYSVIIHSYTTFN